MHRIDTEGSVNGKFYDGDPSPTEPVGATYLNDEWLNSIQEEVCSLVEGQGISLEKKRSDQLLDAFQRGVE